MSDPTPAPRSTRSGPGKVLVAVYGVFALAACARAGVQLATRFDEAPLAYLLSAAAGVIYVVATITLARGTRTSRRVATAAILLELVGVLTVGLLSVFDRAAFPRATVWSDFGSGYGFVPLLLPILGLWWLWSTRPRRPQDAGTTRSAWSGGTDVVRRDGPPDPRSRRAA